MACTLLFGLLFLLTFFGLHSANEIQSGHVANVDIFQLTKANFSDFIEVNQFVLVQFYAPWCGNCRVLAPEYQEVARRLLFHEPPIKLAKVDATKEDELSSKYRIDCYPTLIFFHQKKSLIYTGERKADDICKWLKRHAKTQPTTFLKSVEELEIFMEMNPVSIIGFLRCPKSQAASNFFSVAKDLENYTFGFTVDHEAFQKYDLAEDSIIIFKDYDEQKTVYKGAFDIGGIKTFIERETTPLIVEFKQPLAIKIFEGPFKTHLLLFVPNTSLDLVTALQNVSREYREHILFVLVNTDDPQSQCIVEYFLIDDPKTPTIRLLTSSNNFKYKPKEIDFTPNAIKVFLDDFIYGRLEPHLVSERLPDDWNQNPVKTLVASTFEEIALDKNKNVVVKFYAPWCDYCQRLSPIYEELGEYYKNNKTIIIAKLNSARNELKSVKVSAFPTIRLFRKGDNKAIEFKGGRSLEELIEFLELNCREDEHEPIENHEIFEAAYESKTQAFDSSPNNEQRMLAAEAFAKDNSIEEPMKSTEGVDAKFDDTEMESPNETISRIIENTLKRNSSNRKDEL